MLRAAGRVVNCMAIDVATVPGCIVEKCHRFGTVATSVWGGEGRGNKLQ